MEIIFETITKKDKGLFEKINEFFNEDKELKNYYKESEKIEFWTDFIHTTHKLLEMLYKLKSQGFASFV